MRKIVRKDDFPQLFHFSDEQITAEKYLTTHSPQQIVDDQNAESVDVWKGVLAFIDTDYVWKDFVIEGVAVLPKSVNQIDASKLAIKPIFLVDENEDRVRETVYARGLWDNADTYSDDVKEIEVRWVDLFNKYIKSEVKKYGYRYYKINDREGFLKMIIKEIRDWLGESTITQD